MGMDAQLRSSLATLPLPRLGPTPFTLPGPTSEATVALVSSAGLTAMDDAPFVPGDQSFRVIAHGTSRLVMSQGSQNFDRSGFLADPNVVLPMDRLDELAAVGRIGRPADTHITFNGALGELSTIVEDTGPAAATHLREQGTDVVILTPV